MYEALFGMKQRNPFQHGLHRLHITYTNSKHHEIMEQQNCCLKAVTRKWLRRCNKKYGRRGRKIDARESEGRTIAAHHHSGQASFLSGAGVPYKLTKFQLPSTFVRKTDIRSPPLLGNFESTLCVPRWGWIFIR
jgi:hypothetical protein